MTAACADATAWSAAVFAAAAASCCCCATRLTAILCAIVAFCLSAIFCGIINLFTCVPRPRYRYVSMARAHAVHCRDERALAGVHRASVSSCRRKTRLSTATSDLEHTRTHASTHTHAHTHSRGRSHTHAHVRTHTHTHTRARTHTHTHARRQSQKWLRRTVVSGGAWVGARCRACWMYAECMRT